MAEIDVSIVMPCYNDGQYIREAIDSVRLAENPNVEVIVINDGSDDGATNTVLGSLAGERIRVLHTEHIGPSGARNAGIRQAGGRYILPLDADDRIDAAYIPAAMALLEENPGIGVAYCHAELFGEKTGRWALPDYSFERMLVENLVFVSAMFRKSDWEAVGGFRTDMKEGMEDYDFFIGILALGRTIVQLPETYFFYRIKKKSRTTEFLMDQEAVRRAFHQIYEHHAAFYQAHAQCYAEALRNELIVQKAEKEQILRSLGWLNRIRSFAPAKALARKLIGR